MFGDEGGKGKSMNSFLRHLSKSSSSTSPHTSSLYHNHAKKSISEDQKIIGAQFSHLTLVHRTHSSTSLDEITPSAGGLVANTGGESKNGNIDKKLKKSKKRKSKDLKQQILNNKYMDSDDDWDASVDDSDDQRSVTSLANIHASSNALSNNMSLENGSSSPSNVYIDDGEMEGTKNDNSLNSKYLEYNSQDLLKAKFEKIIDDPLYILNVVDGPDISKFDENLINTVGAKEEMNASIARFNRFKKILTSVNNINLEDLKKLSWNGVPNELKAVVWQLLYGYLSTNSQRRIEILKKKRSEYLQQIKQEVLDKNESEMDNVTFHQIKIDIPRTNPHIKLYSHPAIQKSLEKILYLWAIRHPASGYVQGINDIITPFFQVFLFSYLNLPKIDYLDTSMIDPDLIPNVIFDTVEADTYWCLTRLLDTIQDNYIHAQPGIIRQVEELKDLTNRIDSALVKHLEDENVQFLQFSFRWMNCLLMRELNMNNIIRMWDTYISEGTNGFSDFHVYVCAAFLVKWSDKLKQLDFQEIMIFLQSLPTKNWENKHIQLLLSEAYMWQTLYKNATAHLR